MKERDRLAALGQMSAGLAHEIRNPLGAIKAAAQYVEEIAEEENEDTEYLSVIVEEVDRLNRVVNDFLAYARPSNGAPAQLDVNEILKRTLQVFETGREDKTDLIIDYADNLPGVLIDGERLHQVFLNLIINAVQAMKDQDNPMLEISTRFRKLRRVQRSSASTEFATFVEIRFADNGPGIDLEILQNVFIPFFTTKSQGSGLGLSICQRIIRNAGGEIELRSQKGEGTIFTVVLPAAENDQ
jgi:nitrogen-specific signal transduction histidine kinase